MIRREANILVVDDEEIVCKSCQRVLNEEGHKVTTTRIGLDALKKIEVGSFDIVFVDIRIPDLNGLSLLSRIKERQPGVEVIMITGYPSIETIKQALKSGASDYISKPLTPLAIIKLTAEALERRAWSIHKCIREDITSENHFDSDNQCWLLYEGQGKIKIGLERKYLESIGAVVYIDFPIEDEKIERDETLFTILTRDRQIYDITSPISGYVSRVNYELLQDINLLNNGSDNASWVVQIDSAQKEENSIESGKIDSSRSLS